jgi:hypothetical protein
MTDIIFAAGGAPRDRGLAEHTADPLPHYVSDAPFDPYVVERMTPAQERFYMASEWRMVWWKLRRHRIAFLSGAILLTMYVSILFCDLCPASASPDLRSGPSRTTVCLRV